MIVNLKELSNMGEYRRQNNYNTQRRSEYLKLVLENYTKKFLAKIFEKRKIQVNDTRNETGNTEKTLSKHLKCK